jgi:flavin reductase (DIM6/NTAB) family NADH-FMN oxidoreductase RutF
MRPGKEKVMPDDFREISPTQITDNPFTLIDKDWMLITPGTLDSFNTMTASWGGLGVLWNKSIAFCFIRPSRYTYGFMEKAQRYTLCFFDDTYRDALNFCGDHSGRDADKIAATGLTPVGAASGAVYFAQARLVLECSKLYFQDLDPDHFLDPAIEGNYRNQDYHRMYIGEIVRCLTK